MRRRKFIQVLAGSVAWPLTAHAQQTAPVVGFLHAASADANAHVLVGFRQGLKEAGFIEGQNVQIEYSWADGRYDRMTPLAAEFVNRKVAAILAGALPAAIAAKAATSTIPIVFVMGADAVKFGLAVSLNRPGGNITGVSQLYRELGAKRLEILREIALSRGLIAVLVNSRNPNTEDHLAEIRTAAQSIGQQIEVFDAFSESDIDTAFSQIAERKAAALLLSDDPVLTVRREQVIAQAARHRLPAIYYAREFAAEGGLLSYGSVSADNYRQAGVYVGRILGGAKPADLPILQPSKFELVINLKTAKALGLKVSPAIIARADETIE
jgi:putative tryptophan/tyrosine transport system substrate-binding protein